MNEIFVQIINELKTERGWTQARIAAELGIDASAVSQYMSGKHSPDTLMHLLFAGLTSNTEKRDWLVRRKLTSTQLALLLRGLCQVDETTKTSAEDRMKVQAFRRFLNRADPQAIASVMYLISKI